MCVLCVLFCYIYCHFHHNRDKGDPEGVMETSIFELELGRALDPACYNSFITFHQEQSNWSCYHYKYYTCVCACVCVYVSKHRTG